MKKFMLLFVIFFIAACGSDELSSDKEAVSDTNGKLVKVTAKVFEESLLINKEEVLEDETLEALEQKETLQEEEQSTTASKERESSSDNKKAAPVKEPATPKKDKPKEPAPAPASEKKKEPVQQNNHAEKSNKEPEQPDKEPEAPEEVVKEEPVKEATEKPVKSESHQINSFEQQVVALTNKEREKQGLPALKIDITLSKVSRLKSEDMQQNNYFSHDSPTYGSPFDMMSQFGISYHVAAENIAFGQTSPEEVVTAWMNSEGHRKNILRDNITHIGVGYVANGHYWTQQFIAK